MKNCARYNEGLATMLGEVDVRFISQLGLFDRTHGRVDGGKDSRILLKYHPDLAGCFQAR